MNFDVGGPQLTLMTNAVYKAAVTIRGREKLPDVLFHYTNAEGLHGILGSKTLWATGFKFLNDQSEYNYGNLFVQDLLLNRSDEFAKRLAKAWPKTGAGWADVIPHYVASTCDTGDLIGQWRGYSSLNDGCAVAFRRLALESRQTKESRLHVIPIFYSPDQQRRLVERVLNVAFEVFASAERRTKSKVLDHAIFALHRAILLLKHPSFAGEREWRLILFDVSGSSENFRVVQGQIVPYLNIPLAPDDIDHIIQGPGLYRLASTDTISRFALKCGSRGIAVKRSHVPLG